MRSEPLLKGSFKGGFEVPSKGVFRVPLKVLGSLQRGLKGSRVPLKGGAVRGCIEPSGFLASHEPKGLGPSEKGGFGFTVWGLVI